MEELETQRVSAKAGKITYDDFGVRCAMARDGGHGAPLTKLDSVAAGCCDAGLDCKVEYPYELAGSLVMTFRRSGEQDRIFELHAMRDGSVKVSDISSTRDDGWHVSRENEVLIKAIRYAVMQRADLGGWSGLEPCTPPEDAAEEFTPSPFDEETTKRAVACKWPTSARWPASARWRKEFDTARFNVPELFGSPSWHDVSWHNDTCPSFMLDKGLLTVYVEAVDPNARESDNPRFSVVASWPDRECADGWAQTLFMTDDLVELLRFCLDRTVKVARAMASLINGCVEVTPEALDAAMAQTV